ncbi:MAG: hypothetical protein GF414_00325 [Candidatus Altiarchaeales archaeon]|nr:hypothetical protein [Candidatus Altiarchaeales archaeon]
MSMPVYVSTKETVIDGYKIKVGRNYINRYFDTYLFTFLTLVTDEALDVLEDIYNNTLDMAIQEPLSEYKQIIFSNRTDAVCTVTVNRSNTFTVAADETYVIKNERTIYSMSATGAGAGNVTLQGLFRVP